MPESQPPRSSTTGVPKTSSPAPYIAGIAVLVLLIGALAWFKFGREKPAPAPPVVQTVSATPPPPILDIPPPPELDAATDAEADAAVKPRAGMSLCANPCDATAPPQLQAALAAAGAAARGCYERALRTNESLQGRVVVAVRVNSAGKVCSASVAQDQLGSSEVSSCVLSLYRARSFPPATGGRCVDVNVPLSFKPRETK